MSKLTIPFERVEESKNRKVMIGCEEIVIGTFGAGDIPFKVFQSENRNVITIVADGYYNHIILNNIIIEVLKVGLKLTA